MAKESADAALQRWELLEIVQNEYRSFIPFLEDVMTFLGFSTTEIQRDIAAYLQYGPHYLMIQAQRGQAKSTITAAFAVWNLIHNPKCRVLIVSAGGTMASEISTLIVRIIQNLDVLECMRPDKNNGDRTSTDAFDLHYTLKGVDKSPSVSCVGITGTLQGKRADLLIADDVESSKNSLTSTQRAQLLHLTRDFTSQCSTGRIIYLGTPQSQDSIYNTLPGRGYDVRIWPGRYPTQEQLSKYGNHLAPIILRNLQENPELGFGGGMLGDQGQPTDPQLLDEDKLQFKEMDQGPSYFQLQHMLNTSLLDAMRYPLKSSNLIALRLMPQQQLPLEIYRGYGGDALTNHTIDSFSFNLMRAHDMSKETAKPQGVCMYIDPAGGGQNADETGYAVTAFLNGTVYILDAGGVPGGYSQESMTTLADVAVKWQPSVVKIEKNFGYGAFREVWLPILRARYAVSSVEDDMVTGQKERRIIDTLEPIMARGSLVINEDIVENEKTDLQRYGVQNRLTYSLFHQMNKITRDRGALIHDDRLDALEGAVRHWVQYIIIDQKGAAEREKDKTLTAWFKDPLGHLAAQNNKRGPRRGGSLMSKYKR